MKKLFKKLKGFTLTELIVVIAIIGILAAVLIPSITGYIKKAKKSTDVQMAGEMTREIQWYCLDNDMNQDNITGTDVRTMLILRGYDLVPSAKDWSFVYNVDNKKVEVSEFKKGELVAAMDYDPVDPTEIKKNRFLIGEGQNPIEQAVKTLCNLESLDQYATIEQKIYGKGDLVKYAELIETFNPQTTLYISNGYVLTNENKPGKTKVVFLDKTVHIPDITSTTYRLLTTIKKIPECILSSDKANMNLIKDSNIKFIEQGDIPQLDISDDYTLTLGNMITSSKSQTITIGVSKIEHQVSKANSTLNGVSDDSNIISISSSTITTNKLDKLNNANLDWTDSNAINQAIQEDGALDKLKAIKVKITRIAKVSYFGEKGIIAYCEKELTPDIIWVSFSDYINLKELIKQ